MTIKKSEVESITNMKSINGNTVPNQFVITRLETTLFQSYGSIIAEYNRSVKELVLYEDWNDSRTTMKYLKQFMNEYTCFYINEKKDIEKLIKNNKIKVATPQENV